MNQAFFADLRQARGDLRVDHSNTCQITRPPGSWILAPGSLLITDLLITDYFWGHLSRLDEPPLCSSAETGMILAPPISNLYE